MGDRDHLKRSILEELSTLHNKQYFSGLTSRGHGKLLEENPPQNPLLY